MSQRVGSDQIGGNAMVRQPQPDWFLNIFKSARIWGTHPDVTKRKPEALVYWFAQRIRWFFGFGCFGCFAPSVGIVKMLSASRPRWPWRDFEDIRTSHPSTFRSQKNTFGKYEKGIPTAPSKYLSLQYWWLKCNLIILNLQIQTDWSVQASHSNWLVPHTTHGAWRLGNG